MSQRMLAATALCLLMVWLTACGQDKTLSSYPLKASFQVETPPTAGSLQIRLSPDGRNLIATALTEDGDRVLWLRTLDNPDGRVLPGTNGAGSSFWSPDSRFIAFNVSGKLMKVDLSGPPPQTIAEVTSVSGGAWNAEGVIVLGSGSGPLNRVAATGGQPEAASVLDTSLQETSHRYPYFLPDGRHFLYLAVSNKPENNAIYVGSLDSKDRKRLLKCSQEAVYASSGHLLFMREKTLMAQVLDPKSLELLGEPFPVESEVNVNTGNHKSGFSVSDNGALAYRQVSALATSQLVWVDREGREIGAVGPEAAYKEK